MGEQAQSASENLLGTAEEIKQLLLRRKKGCPAPPILGIDIIKVKVSAWISEFGNPDVKPKRHNQYFHLVDIMMVCLNCKRLKPETKLEIES
jgi:hypothetical protein